MPECQKLWETKTPATAETMATAGKPEKARTTEKSKTPANHEFW
jgi:hypothetical protein